MSTLLSPQARRLAALQCLAACCLALLLALLLFAAPVHAHHSLTLHYDSTRPMQLSGKVISYKLQNPHIEVVLEVRKPGGAAETWLVETLPASRAANITPPLTETTLKPGDLVKFNGWPAKDGTRRLSGNSMVLPNGQEVLLRPGYAGTSP